MASPDLEIDNVQTDGLIYRQDATLGQRVSAMREANIPLASVGGVAFFRENIVDNEDIMRILKSCLQCEPFCFGLYRTLGPVPGAYSFRKSNPDLPVESVIVHLLEKQARVLMWKASHRVDVPSFRGSIGLWQATRTELEAAGLEPVEEIFENGGWCVRDTRVFMEVLNGKAITCAIGKKEVVQKWTPMKLHESLKPAVEEIPMFKFNVIYVK